MSKTRQARFPDGPVWVRTYPVTFLHDVTHADQSSAWHVLTFAVRGHLELVTADARRIVPSDRAVWVPAGTRHTQHMRAPISMRSLYIAPGAFRTAPSAVRTIAVSPFLRELVQHITRIGALDHRTPAHAHLAAVLFDLLAAADDIPLELRMPRDPRARKLADLVTAELASDRSIARLARKSGASLRTLERCFVTETGLNVGEWRRRVRLFHALRLLESGMPATEVALEVGYSTPSAFTVAFTRQFGRSPSGRRHG